MPLIIAPPTSVSIFLAVSMQQQGLVPNQGNAAVIYSGIILTLIGVFPPLGRFVSQVCSVPPALLRYFVLPVAVAAARTVYSGFNSSRHLDWYRLADSVSGLP
jgi:predicted benzoate:H+ symporter BenE